MCCFRNVNDIDFVLWSCIPNTYYMILCNTYHSYKHIYKYNIKYIIYLYLKNNTVWQLNIMVLSNKILHSQTGYGYSNVCNLSILCPFFSINPNDDPITVLDPPAYSAFWIIFILAKFESVWSILSPFPPSQYFVNWTSYLSQKAPEPIFLLLLVPQVSFQGCLARVWQNDHRSSGAPQASHIHTYTIDIPVRVCLIEKTKTFDDTANI